MKFINKKSGFTLIELLIVIAILTVLFAITIVAVNPTRQFQKANNTQRRSDVNAILNAMYQYAADHRGSLPVFVPSTSTVQIGTGTTTCAIIASCGATSTIANCVDLTSALVPDYLASIPYDPTVGLASSTYYAMTRSANGNRITVTACGAEDGESISVIR